MLHDENRQQNKGATYGNFLRAMLATMKDKEIKDASPSSMAFILLSSLVAEFDLYDKPVAHSEYVETKLGT